MKVVIVAKTRMQSGACVGAITFEGQSVRLIAPDQDIRDHFNLEYQIGDVWEIDGAAPETLTPPHVEDIVVREKRRLRRVELERVIGFIEKTMPPADGGPDALFDGFLRRAPWGPLYVAEPDTPCRSTMFWRPDCDLVRDEEGKRIRYRYPTEDGGRTLTFVGFQEPVGVIPAGALLRVSLAHWWRPSDQPEHELRCYVQLSGWYEFDPESGKITPRAGVRTNAQAANVAIPAESRADPARALLKSVFGYDDFLPLQEKVIDNVLARRDTLAIMPTGGGKSMCYQLPALLFEGLTVVVSPLIALMQDQVDALRAVGAPAAFLNSTVGYRAYLETANAVRAGQIKLLYMAPETLIRPETLVMLDSSNVDCITIDEAHCISSWGHDFRPEYRQLLPIRKRYARAVCVALTATATKRVQDDIKEVLGFSASDTFVASFNRPNLMLTVDPRINRLPQMMAFLDAHREEAGIIYTNRRRDAEQLAAQLTQLGRSARPYHAGMDDASRREHQRRFTRDEGQIIVATIAFGMGINKSNVRFILHTALPENLENYYQQIGRAGRDGMPADCLLLWGKQDIVVIRSFIKESAPEEQPGKEARLQAMLRYAEWEGCRRGPLLAYFGEKISGNCSACDRCLGRDKAASGAAARLAVEQLEGAGLPRRAPEAAGGEALAVNLQQERALFEELRKLRLALAREARLPPFVIFSDKTLQEMAQTRPQTEAELRAVSGVGDKKLATYGARFLEAVKAFCATQGANPEMQATSAAQGEALAPEARRVEMGAFFNSGLAVEDLARRYGVQPSTVLRYLMEYAGGGHELDGERLLPYVEAPDALRGDAFALFAELGVDELRPVYDALGGKVSYDDLRLLRIYFRSQTAICPPRAAGAQPPTEGQDRT